MFAKRKMEREFTVVFSAFIYQIYRILKQQSRDLNYVLTLECPIFLHYISN